MRDERYSSRRDGYGDDDEARERSLSDSRWRERIARIRREPAGLSGAAKFLIVAGILAVVLVPIILYLIVEGVDVGRPQMGGGGPIAHDRNPLPPVPIINDPKPVVPDKLAREMKPVFADLGDAFRARDGQRAVAFFDVDRMIDEAEQWGLPRLPQGNRAASVQGARLGMARALQQQAALLQWSGSEIKQIKLLRLGEAMIVARHPAENGAIIKMRWWVTNRGGPWRIYDFEDLDVSLRASTTIASLGGLGLQNLQGLAQDMDHMRQALTAIGINRDADAAERHLQQIRQGKLPRTLDGVRFLALGMIHAQRGRFQESLTDLDQAQALNPDMPCLDLWKAVAHNGLQNWQKALDHVRKYEDLLGDDATVCFERGLALNGLRRFPEACAALRKSLDYDPKNGAVFFFLVRSLQFGDARDDLAGRFRKLGDPHKEFERCAEDCRLARDHESLEILALAMRRLEPQHDSADYYLALAKAFNRKSAEAIKQFKSALARQNDKFKRDQYSANFVNAMLGGGQVGDAYLAVPDPKETFRFLAAELLKTYRVDDLGRLVKVHAKKDGDDPFLPFYQGAAYVSAGQYARAEKAFADGMAHRPDALILDNFRRSRVEARYYTGKALSAYAEIGPKDDTFQQLASMLFLDKNYPQLETLIAEHARTNPNHRDLATYRFRIKIARKQFDEGIALFKEAWTKAAPEMRTGLLNNFLIDMVDARAPLRGYEAAPDAKAAFQFLAQDLQSFGYLEDLHRLIDKHRGKHPGDPRLDLYAGHRFVADKAWDKAAQVLAAGLKKDLSDDPGGQVRARMEQLHFWAMYKCGRGLAAYAQATLPQRAFETLAGFCAADKNDKELQALLAAHRRDFPDDPALLLLDARAKVWQKRIDDAIPLFQAACKKETVDYKRADNIFVFAGELTDLGHGLEAYRAVVNSADEQERKNALRTIAGRLVFKKDAAELAKVVGEHAKHFAADPLLLLYQGELALLRGDSDAAIKTFSAGLAKALPNEAWSFRNGLSRASIKAGQVVKAYHETKSAQPRAFEDLAYLCLAEKDGAQLQALLAAHREADPDDDALAVWDLEVLWLKRDYEGVLGFLAAHHDDLAGPRHRFKVQSYQVRGLVHLKRFPEAIREAEAVAAKNGDRLLALLAHAANADVKQTLALMERYPRQDYFLRNCYQDPDLGPLLKSDAFQPFRQRFPEPQPMPLFDDRFRDDDLP